MAGNNELRLLRDIATRRLGGFWLLQKEKEIGRKGFVLLYSSSPACRVFGLVDKWSGA